MMNKYLIEVFVPEIQKSFDIYVPCNKKIGTIKKVILNSIRELSEGYYNKTINDVIFVDKDTSFEYTNNDSLVKESGIVNGTRIVII